jgi:hypothetical protein
MLPAATDTAPHNGTRTSRAAAESVRRSIARDLDLIVGALAQYARVGATCDELEVTLRLSHQTCSARINQARKRGMIRDSGRTRETRTGRQAIVWVVN